MLLLLLYFILHVLFADAENGKVHGHVEIKNVRLPNTHLGSVGKNYLVHNSSIYIDKTENILRVPDINKNYDELKTKRKNIKKSPKRTVQKIIKKNRSRRKLYMNLMTSAPTKPPMNGDELEQFYAQEELMQKNDNVTSIQVNQKRKKKWPVARYPMPFQHLASKKETYRRNRRSAERQLFILTDLNEMKFLKGGKDENVVNAHIKRYW